MVAICIVSFVVFFFIGFFVEAGKELIGGIFRLIFNLFFGVLKLFKKMVIG